MTNLAFFSAQYDGSKVRITSDGKVSVFDAIAATLKKDNPRSDWSRLIETYPEVVARCDNFQFSGQGQRPTPITDEEGLYQILMLLPGAKAAEFRSWMASTMARYRQGDISLAQEIIDRAAVVNQNFTVYADQQMLNVQDQISLIDYMFTGIVKAGVDLKIAESAKMESLAAQFPSMKPAIELAKQSLMLQTPDEGRRYNVTELGKMLAERLGLPNDIKPTQINKALQQAGFQEAKYRTNSKGKQVKEWHLTTAGESYGRLFLQSAQGNSKTIPAIRWLSEVLDAIASWVNR